MLLQPFPLPTEKESEPSAGQDHPVEPRFFDRFVCRVGGMSWRPLIGSRAAASVDFLTRAWDLEQRLLTDAAPLSERLHERIGGNPDKVQRNALIALRRDIHNLRPPKAKHLAHLEGDLRRNVDAFTAAHQQLHDLRQAFEAAFPEELTQSREHFRQAIRQPDFQNALLLSSRALHQAQDRYLRARRVRARERQIERGLARYLTRMAAKATPFATFCSVLPGRFAPDEGTDTREDTREDTRQDTAIELGFQGDPLAKRTLVRLNKGLQTVCQRHLIRDIEGRRHLFVVLNPTLRQMADDPLWFLSMATGRETFQRLPDQPVLALLRQLLAQRTPNNTPCSAAELIYELAAQPEIEAPAEAIGAYVDRLIDIGFLQATFGIPAQAMDWNPRFQHFLQTVDHPRARHAEALLRELDGLTRDYGSTPMSERPRQLARLDDAFENFITEHNLSVRINGMIFEDATADAEAVLPRGPDVTSLERDLTEYIDLTSRATYLRRDLINMRHFFDHHYGPETQAVPLLQFYEDFYREHYKDHRERELSNRQRPFTGEARERLANPFDLELVGRLNTASENLSNLLADRWAKCQGDEIALDSTDLRQALGNLDPVQCTDGWSMVIFGDWVHDSEGGRLVVRRGKYTTGFGKMYSRFLDLFPTDFTESVLANNEARTPGLLAELCDDANFNANLHPPFLPHEISYPIGESRGHGRAILPTDLEVQRGDLDIHCLELRHRQTGERVFPVDTGFMTPSARPPLYQLMASFAPSSSFMLPMPAGIGPRYTPDSPITVRPRVTLNRRLILYRKTWLVPSFAYPVVEDGESERDYFARIDRWRRQQGLPERVYVRFGRLIGEASKHPSLPPRSDADADPSQEPELLKPQFIDFANPILVGLFGRMAPGPRFLAKIEECLPDVDQLARHDGDPVSAELVLQLDFPAAASETRDTDRLESEGESRL